MHQSFDCYVTPREQKNAESRARRAALKAEGLCISARSHGPATDGVLCRRCREQHRKSH